MLDFLKREAVGIPYYAWGAAILGALILIVIIIIVACVKKGKDGNGEGVKTAESTAVGSGAEP